MVEEEASNTLLVETGMRSQLTASNVCIQCLQSQLSHTLCPCAGMKASFTLALHTGWVFTLPLTGRHTVGNGCMAESMGEYCIVLLQQCGTSAQAFSAFHWVYTLH